MAIHSVRARCIQSFIHCRPRDTLHCDIQITGGRQRKAYRLTKRGIAALKEARGLINELVKEVMEGQ